MRRTRRRGWLGPAVVLVVAALTRFWAIGVPGVFIFDETYYVKDAWSLVHLGYEGSWPKNADAAFQAGHLDLFTKAASYVAHPPLGKWIIGLGELLTGGANPVGWRLSVAIVGVLAVALVMLVTHRMFATPVVTTVAGGLFAIDNQAILMSRVGLLDNMVMFFGLAAFACILEDRSWTERRLGVWLMRRRREVGGWGPTFLWRPWLIGAGVLLGLCTAIKWSGLYFLAGFAIYSIAVDMMLRRRAGIRYWYSASVLKQLPATLLNLLPTALLAYLAGWTGWFVTSGGWDRNYLRDGGTRFTGLLSWVPEPLQNLWHWHAEIYVFHVNLDSPHPYSTPAILWPLIARPTSMYWDPASLSGGSGCRWGSCASAITDIPNPLIWYAGIAAAIYLIVRLIRRREWQAGMLLMGIAAGYLPWLAYPRRTMFFFYSIAFEPYLVIGLAAVIGLMVLRPSAVDSPDAILAAEARYGMKVRRGLVVGFLGLAVLVSAFFYPLDTGMQTPYWFWHIHMWSPTWI
ncbi:MAG: dolichyl-phosphate-mannose-protein mannosyltransferase [Microbacteriaceae bacterium]|nr:dolichyl-phosphate-mannose-protein mannosyltransferase [Microbacteriaceae bacterium]